MRFKIRIKLEYQLTCLTIIPIVIALGILAAVIVDYTKNEDNTETVSRIDNESSSGTDGIGQGSLVTTTSLKTSEERSRSRTTDKPTRHTADRFYTSSYRTRNKATRGVGHAKSLACGKFPAPTKQNTYCNPPVNLISGVFGVKDSALTSSHNRSYGKGGKYIDNTICARSSGRHRICRWSYWQPFTSASAWIQVDLGSAHYIMSIKTRGENNYNHVKSYKLSNSQQQFYPRGKKPMVFCGNSIHKNDVVVENFLNPPTVTRIIRLHIVEKSRRAALAFELTGCKD